MKKVNLLYYILLISILSSCESDPQWKAQRLSYTDSIVPSWYTAEVSLKIDEPSDALTKNVVIVYSLKNNFSSEEKANMTCNEKGQWIAELKELKDSSTYYVRYLFSPAYLQPDSKVSSFQTIPLPAPKIQTKEATGITETTAILHGSAELGESKDEIIERGFYYSLLRVSDFGGKQVKCGNGAGDFSANIEALRANATYYYVAYAINKHGIAYGDTLQFNTLNPY